MIVELFKKNYGKDFRYLRLSNAAGESLVRIDEKKYDDIFYLLENEKNVGKQSEIQNIDKIHRLR